MAERIQRLAVKVHVGSFAFDNIVIHKVGKLIHGTVPGHIELARRAVVPKQNIRHCIAELLPAVGGIQHRRNIFVDPCRGNRIAAHNDYYSIGIGFVHCLDQTFLLFREHNIRSVDLFLAVQQRMVADEHDSDFCG
ncbi:hypothetical protein D3C75_851300 [compost metagenome]